jgi:hypothetical protein
MTRRNQILIVLALLVVAIPSIFIYDYTQNNPKFCTSCHLMNEAYDTWQVSAMHDLSCHTCHESTMVESMQHVYDVLTKNPEDVTKPVVIESVMCQNCHASNDPQWLQVVNTAGHKVHFFGNDDHAECIDCHGMNLHVFRPPEEACLECHDVEKVHASEVMGTNCITCHDFLVNQDELYPLREDCLECHTDKELITISMPPEAHADSTCTTCHNPHGDVTAESCSTCHKVTGGLHDITLHTDCTSCHVPHEEVTVRESCESCHTDKIDHYAPVSCTSCHG